MRIVFRINYLFYSVDIDRKFPKIFIKTLIFRHVDFNHLRKVVRFGKSVKDFAF